MGRYESRARSRLFGVGVGEKSNKVAVITLSLMHASKTALTQALAHSKTSSRRQNGWGRIPGALVDLTVVRGARQRQRFSSSSTSSCATAATVTGAWAGGVYSNASRDSQSRRGNASVGVGSRRGAHAHALAMKPAPSTSPSSSPSSSRHSTPPLELRGGYLRPSGLYRGELRQRPAVEKEEEEKRRRELALPRAAVLLRERVEALVERTGTSSNEVRGGEGGTSSSLSSL